MHDVLKVGGELQISAPRNNFELCDEADHSIFIAGGVGITAMWGMIQVLEEANRPWQLFYSCKAPERAAFLEELSHFRDRVYGELDSDQNRALYINFTHEIKRRLDIVSIVEKAPESTHFYCCGPQEMLDDFLRACAAIPPESVHFERFTASGPIEKQQEEFEIVLRRSKRTLRVAPGISILDTLLEAGIQVPYQCKEGICGTCEIRVISGVPDHRDSILTDEEKNAGDTMMICCSGSQSGTLVLDC